MKKTKSSILIIVLYLFYSLIGIIAKHNAMTSAPASISFFSLLALQLLCLFIFALGWQYILKISTLSKAYAFKGTVVLWGMLFARFIFKESITFNNIIGSIIIAMGIGVLMNEN